VFQVGDAVVPEGALVALVPPGTTPVGTTLPALAPWSAPAPAAAVAAPAPLLALVGTAPAVSEAVPPTMTEAMLKAVIEAVAPGAAKRSLAATLDPRPAPGAEEQPGAEERRAMAVWRVGEGGTTRTGSVSRVRTSRSAALFSLGCIHSQRTPPAI
jgi:hypothetical protein